MSVEGISITSPPLLVPPGTYVAEALIYTESYLLVFPAVDLDDLLGADGVTVTVGGGGWTTSGGGASTCGSGSSLSWEIGSFSTC